MFWKPTSKTFRRLATDEDGAVTVDFVVLCGAVVGIGLAMANALHGNLTTSVAENPLAMEAADGG